MDVTTDEHKELEGAMKEANKLESKVPEMTTGAVKKDEFAYSKPEVHPAPADSETTTSEQSQQHPEDSEP